MVGGYGWPLMKKRKASALRTIPYREVREDRKEVMIVCCRLET